MNLYRTAGIVAISVTMSYSMVRGVSWIMSPAAPQVVRTPAAKIRPLPKDLDMLMAEGRELSPEKLAALQQQITKDPGNTRARALVLAGSSNVYLDADMRRIHDEQVVWFVANLPGSPILSGGEINVDNVSDARTYDLISQLYEEALAREPKNIEVMSNFAALLLIPEKDRAISLYQQAAKLDQKNPRRFDKIAFAYVLRSRGVFGTRNVGDASLAVDYYLKARSLGGSVSGTFFVEAAFDAKRYDVVERESKTLLQGDADDVHAAHTNLGRLALLRGDVPTARQHLLDSAKVEGSPVLGSFGPGMELAKELLAKGERKTVLAYLDACGKFWKDERQARWRKQVADGGTPDWD